MNNSREKPIGVFDSGIGGLTVAREVCQQLPGLDLVYLGDTARLPYGAKSPDTVTRYALQGVRFLEEAKIEVLVIACNTASACAIPALREAYPNTPVLGVVEPGARAAVAATKSGSIGVIGTQGTVNSDSYREAILALAPDARVTQKACPLLVPLAEVGWLEHEVTELTLKTYLTPLLEHTAEHDPIDTLVLGCTHYPALKPAIRSALAKLAPTRTIALVDSAEAVTAELAVLTGAKPGQGSRHIYVTDLPKRFAGVAQTFWRAALPEVTHIDL